MTDYSLWEFILNGDSPTLTRIVDDIVQVIAPTTADQRLAKKNELKARGTLLMALLDKHQLKFNIHKDAKYLIETIEKRLQKLISQLEILADPEDQSLDDLFKNLKIYEAEVKSSSFTSHTTQNIAFVSSNNTDNTNELVSAVPSVSVASTKTPVSTLPNADNLSDAVIYSFFASQSNSPQLDNEALKQIYADDLEEMDLKWQMAMLTMRDRRFLQRTGRNLGANRTTAIGFDMSKVECYNCHRRGHFERECRSPKDTRNKDTQRRTVPVETSTSNDLVSECDGVGSYDWSFPTDKEPTNYAIMTFTSSSSFSSSGSDNKVAPCSKACSKAYATLQSHYDKLTVDFRKSQFHVLSYKSGLESVKARLVVYQQNENMFEEDIKLLKLDVIQITDKTGLRYDNQVFNSHMFDCDELSSSKSDDSVPTSPVNDRYKSSEGYHVVPPPYTRTFMPPKLNLFFHDAPTVRHLLSQLSILTKLQTLGHAFQSLEVLSIPGLEKLVLFVKVCKSLNHLIKDCDYYEKKMVQKPVWNHAMRVNHQNSAKMTHPHYNKHVVPTTILTRSRLIPFNGARPVTTVVSLPTVNSLKPVKHVVTKAHSPIRRPINHRPAPKNSNFYQKVTTIKAKKVNAVQGTKGMWVWKPKCTVLNHVSKLTSASMTLKQFYYTDALGRSKNQWRICCIWWESKGGKGKIKTCKLDFDDVYFVKELKFNMFSVSQMCDKKNSVLFTDIECVVLSSDFKLPNENHVLLRVPRENNMYNVDLKNVVPSGDLTCLFAKATLDESNLWHRKLGHINFKIMNKLVKGNLVSGLPSKVFKNNHTCVACKKGKQHRASWSGPKWLFDIDTLTQSMNYQPVVVGNQPNHNAGIQENLNVGKVGKETKSAQKYVFLPLWSTGSKNSQNTDANAAFDVNENENEVHVSPSSSDKPKKHDEKAKREAKGKSPIDLSTGVRDLRDEFKEFSVNNTNRVNAASAPVTAVGLNPTNSTNNFNVASPSDNVVSTKFEISRKSSFVDPSHYPDELDMSALEDIIYSDDEEDVGAEADFSYSKTNISVRPIPTTRVHKDHHVSQIIGELTTAPQTRSMERMNPREYTNHSKILVRLKTYKEELLQFKMQRVWVLVDLPKGKRAIGSKWVFRNKKDERGIVIRNKARLAAWGHTQEEGIDYEEVFSSVARIEAIRLFLAYASFMGFMVYQMEVKSAFLYGTIKEEVYVCQPLGFEDPDYPDKVYKVVKVYVDDIIFGSTNKELCKAFEKLMKDKFQTSLMRELTLFFILQVKQKEHRIFISQDKYVAEILRMFGLIDGKSASTPIDTEMPLLKDPDGEDVDVHIYIVKMIFRYLKGKPHLGLWYSKDSPFNLVTYSDSNYAGASLDRKSTTGGCQFLSRRLISWQCKKQIVVATSSTGLNMKKVVVTADTIRQDLRLDDADGVECLPNEEIFTELARMGYKKLPPKLIFYKALFSAQWKFLIHMIVQCISRNFNFSKYILDNMIRNVDSPSKFLMYPQFLQVMINAQVDDLSSYTTKYTSPALTQKVFANMRRIGKGFSGVETPLFDTMLVQPQANAENEDDNERVKKLERKRRSKHSGLKRLRKVGTSQRVESSNDTIIDAQEDASKQGGIAELDVDEDVTLVDVDTIVEMDADIQGRMEEDNTVVKEINAAKPEPIVFDDEDVTMTMAQTLIKMKAEKARILDEQLAKRLEDEEIEQAAAREK
uniref:CCHC-type domain-containing protein n=1 Tax=Tanacetum cinerariifolium TaxID=118510 RepID=A0A6L2MSR4_TANCI|nr:hypothetical protein [Tanacetum cinerariifolium]